jgi:hypothetical protein
MTFRLQYASNLFVDCTLNSFSKLVKPAAPHLVLLGNIGRPESPKTFHFLRYCSKHWDNVFWIPGPHELSNPKGARMTIHEKAMNARAISKQAKVIFMDSKEGVFHEHRIVLLGTPLWTQLTLPPKGEPEFESIFTSAEEAGPVPLTPLFRNKLQKEDLFFLKERSLFWSIVHPDVNLIYLTHTLPTSRLYHEKMSDDAWKRIHMDCVRLPMSPPLKAWIGGAGGFTASTKIGTVPEDQIYCGVNGLYEYPFKGNMSSAYDKECVVEIEPTKPSRLSPLYLPNLVLPPFLSSLLPKTLSLSYA